MSPQPAKQSTRYGQPQITFISRRKIKRLKLQTPGRGINAGAVMDGNRGQNATGRVTGQPWVEKLVEGKRRQ